MVPFVIILVIGLIVAAVIFSAVQESKRREALLAWATARGLRFDTDKDRGFADRYPVFHCLQQGANRYAYNILAGDYDGRRLTAFDYHYETYSTDSKGRRTTHHHNFSAVILSALVPLKPLVIRSENLFDKIKGAFGFDDIDFESAEFSRRFYVASPDRRWAYDVLHQRAMQFLLDSPRFSIQFDRPQVMAWRSSRFGVAELEQAIHVIDGLLDQLPQYVREQAKELA